jgi:hypothetical protein
MLPDHAAKAQAKPCHAIRLAARGFFDVGRPAGGVKAYRGETCLAVLRCAVDARWAGNHLLVIDLALHRLSPSEAKDAHGPSDEIRQRWQHFLPEISGEGLLVTMAAMEK